MVLGSGAFEKWTDHEGGTFKTGIKGPQGTTELPFHFKHVKTHLEGAIYEPESGPFSDAESTLILDFLASRTVNELLCLWHFIIAVLLH